MIRRIEALNYRNLRYVSQRVRPFQVLVGPNGSGKSTFLDVVALIGDFVRHGLDEALLFGPEPGRGRARTLDELIFNQSADGFELAIELGAPESLRPTLHQGGLDEGEPPEAILRYEVAFGKAQNGELEIRSETLWLIDGGRAAGGAQAALLRERAARFGASPSALAPATLVRNGKAPPGWQAIVKKLPQAESDYYQAEGGRWNIQYRLGPRKAALSGLPDDASRFPLALWLRNLLLEGVRVLALNGAAMRRPASPSAARGFSADGSNLPLVVQDLQRHHPAAYYDWVGHVQTILPDVDAIRVNERPEDRHLYLAVQYAGRGEPAPSWLLSDGTLRMLALTVLAYLPEQAGIYLIEEPENGIHPRAIEGVFQSLSSVYGGQVWVATHSPLLLGLAAPAQLLCFASDPAGGVSIAPGDEHPALADWRGEVDLATLYAAGVLG